MAAGPTASRGWISRGSSRRPRRSTRRPIRAPPPSARLSRRSRPRGSPPGAEQGRQPWQPSEQAGPGAGCRHQAAAPGRLECRPHAPGPPACASMPEQTGCSGEASPQVAVDCGGAQAIDRLAHAPRSPGAATTAPTGKARPACRRPFAPPGIGFRIHGRASSPGRIGTSRAMGRNARRNEGRRCSDRLQPGSGRCTVVTCCRGARLEPVRGRSLRSWSVQAGLGPPRRMTRPAEDAPVPALLRRAFSSAVFLDQASSLGPGHGDGAAASPGTACTPRLKRAFQFPRRSSQPRIRCLPAISKRPRDRSDRFFRQEPLP
jgi:hypothetical protein